MEDTTRKKRAINFDLHGKALEMYYSKTNPNGAYKDIGRFLHEHGFEHRQGSGYVSKSELKNGEIVRLFDEMYEKMPWLNQCASHMDLTDIGATYDIQEMQNMKAAYDRTEKEPFSVKGTKTKEQTKSKSGTEKKTSLSDRIKNAKQRADQRNEMRSGKENTKSKNHNQEL